MPHARTSSALAALGGATVASIALLLGGAGSTVATQPEGEMNPADIMAEYAKMNQLGDHHRALDPIVGTFKAKMTAAMEGMPNLEIDGTLTAKWVMNGKFVESVWKSDFMGQPMVGKSFTGYSTIDKKYQTLWMDDMGTTMYYAEGTAGTNPKAFTTYGSETDAMTGQTKRYMDVITIKDNDHYSMVRSYLTAEGPVKGFWIDYTRVK